MKKAPEKLRFAAMAVDVVVFGFVDEELYALVAPVNRPPHYVNVLGFLGGIVDSKETAEETCDRILSEKGGLKQVYTEQLYTFSAVKRDRRNRVVSVAYIGLVRPDVVATYTHEKALFVPVRELKNLAYDHDDMLNMAVRRLQGKLSYTTIAQYLLPRHFTLSELQSVYEIVLRRKFDKRNFRKKVLSLDIVKDTGTMQEGVKNRPASLHEFTSKNLLELELFA
ncbi:MAG: NUDIX domain-containing protein [Candidatus Nomurabacteria bacterium]|nr:MAG: NUDIX domain-containing protein [Candidatus Nomurabacteria bacterium]